MRALSSHSASIASNLIDNPITDPRAPDQEITDTVNSRRTQHGQDALAELGKRARPCKRTAPPADPTPYRIEEIQQHLLHRASTSMQSVPPAPPPALSRSGELSFDLNVPYDASCAESAPALQDVANRPEQPAIAPPPPLSYSHIVGHSRAPSASSLAGSSTHATVMPAPASTGEGPAAPGLPSQAPGSSTAWPIPKTTLYGRQMVLDPETMEMVSRAALYKRKKVRDQVKGDIVSRGALDMRKKRRNRPG
ncbi:hypothetical protein ACFQS6_09135 [Xanthomonas populi]|uniref:hypothetical protein n=1 Tax=Xanthomonas populi TaxID=53414 RepID=UPI001304DCF4|nr:hypothetical protein [Xanthomonas populi]